MTIRLAAAIAVALAATPQKLTQIHPGKGGSPHVRAEFAVDGAAITIEYGRPSVKGRMMFGPAGSAALHPAGKVWAMGADEATIVRTDRELSFGNARLPAGSYSLYLLPLDGPGGLPAGKLIVNAQIGQWHTTYDEKQDVARIDAVVTLEDRPVETLTLSIVDTPAGAIFRMEFANLRADVPFVVH